MGYILRLGGILFLLRQLAGAGQRFVQSKLDWKFLGINKDDFSIDASSQPGNVIGKLRLRLQLTNRNPVGVTITGLTATIRQDGNKLGDIYANNPIILEVNKTITTGVYLTLAAHDLAIRIATIIRDGGGSALSPIDFDGVVYLSDNTSIPIKTKINFISIG